ncbi:hypothetical protein DL767_002032 [Monosporascus sp. MG133]|nr:hypothetical protein DL767_002032 [Monosporascus sp. MG133]
MTQAATVKVQYQAKADCEKSLLPVASAPNEDVRFLVGGNGKGRDEVGYPLDRSETTREEFKRRTRAALFLQELAEGGLVPAEKGDLIVGPAAPLRHFALGNEQQPRWHRRRVMTQGGQRISEYIRVKRDLRDEVKRYATDDKVSVQWNSATGWVPEADSFVVLFEDIPVIYQPTPQEPFLSRVTPAAPASNTNTGVKSNTPGDRIESLDMLAPRDWFQGTNQTGSKAVIGIEKKCPQSDRPQNSPRTETITLPGGRAVETMRPVQAPSPDRRNARGRRR